MDSTGSGLLSVLVFLPLAAALLVVLAARSDGAARWIAGAAALAELALSAIVFLRYDRGGERYQMVDRVSDWIPVESFEVQYFLGVDGLSAPLVLLTGILGMAAVFASWSVKHRVQGVLRLAARAPDGGDGRLPRRWTSYCSS